MPAPTPWSYLDQIEQAKQALSVPVIASLNGITPGGWVRHAKRMRDAGADALELNLYTVATDPRVGAAELEARHLDLVADVRSAVSIPLAVKLSPFYTALANLAVRVDEAGADGLVLFNRFYQADLDLDSRDVVPRLVLSTSEELRAVMAERDYDSVAQLRGSMSRSAMADPAGFERANYMRTLMSWSSHAQVSPGQATSDDPVP